MSNQDEKLTKLLSAVNKYAEDLRSQIVTETASIVNSKLKKAEKEAADEEELVVQQEYAKIKNEISREYSVKEAERRRQLLEKRAQITDSVFNKAQKRLLEYTKEPGYEEKIIIDIRKSAVMMGDYMGATEFYIRFGDETAKRCISSIFTGSKITEDDKIKIGGFRAVNLSRGIVADATLDTALEGRREWFLENSGLSVSEV